MAVYIVTGTLGSGKTLAVINRMKDYIHDGRKVACNIDLNQDVLVSNTNKNPQIYRLPDRPELVDFEMLGEGYHEYDESMFGGIFLDEAALWLNTRNFQDKDRKQIIDFLVNIRKKRWDVYIVIQHQNALDKQVREMFGEHVVTCQRLDRLPIPFFGTLLMLLGFSGKFGKVHVCKVRYGLSPTAPKVDTWLFTGKSLYNAYNTMQEYSPELNNARVHSPLPQSYWEGRPSDWDIFKRKFKAVVSGFQYQARWFFLAGLVLGFNLTGASKEPEKTTEQASAVKQQQQTEKPKEPDYVRISGSFFTDRFKDVYFEKNGEPWYPQYEGYKLLVRHRCHAQLYKNKQKMDVYCGEAVHASAGAESTQLTSNQPDDRQVMDNPTQAAVGTLANMTGIASTDKQPATSNQP